MVGGGDASTHGQGSPAGAEERGRVGVPSVFAGGEWPVSAMLWPCEPPRMSEMGSHVRFLTRVRVVQHLDFGECRDLDETHRVSYLVPVLSADGSSSEAYERCVLVAVPKDATPGSGGVVASTYLHFPSTLQAGDIDVGDGPRKRLVESAGDSNCIKFHFKIAAVGGLPAINTRGRGVDGGKARWWTDLQGLQRLLENNKFTGPMGPGESGAQ